MKFNNITTINAKITKQKEMKKKIKQKIKKIIYNY